MASLDGRAGRWLLAGTSLALCLLVLGGTELALRALRPAALAAAPALQPHVYSAAYGWALRQAMPPTA